MSSNQNINPKDCSYGCSTRIYWNTVENAYFEVFNQKRHLCPNRVNKPSVIANNNTYAVTGGSTTRTSTKPTYYSKMPWNTQPKPKMSNSFELLTGSIDAIQKKYEILSDVVSEYNGKVHGSQRDRDPKTGSIDLLVYYEVPLGNREVVKQRYSNEEFKNFAFD
jgi:hypothetical protein